MRNLLRFAISLFLAHFSQSALSQSASLNINLSKSVLSVSVTAPADIKLNNTGYSRYDEGVNAIIKDHISVVSSGAYIVKVTVGDVIGNSGLLRSSVKITPQLGSGNNGNLDGLMINTALPSNFIPNRQITIIEADHASWNGNTSSNTFNVSYLIGADGAFAGRIPGTSIIPVIYTIILK
ncbi:hypothetical protein SAMN05421813_1352 [Daejeonella rubra]|uniref:Uncharacterized protein n=1 Tax=Daejeonella rubra TaxID=990371 RepID=A0A1G9Y1Z6_9SPHI|nr:hypothetical protein [Daejeonella rubra]SDN03112.1 hypothetical protein SAMN05421813_1352 [Daejeonella rubra]